MGVAPSRLGEGAAPTWEDSAKGGSGVGEGDGLPPEQFGEQIHVGLLVRRLWPLHFPWMWHSLPHPPAHVSGSVPLLIGRLHT